MMMLTQGLESKERIEILLSMTSITSKKVIGALKYHFCDGAKQEYAAAAFSVQKQNLSKNIKILNSAATKLERVKEIDWPAYQSMKQKIEQLTLENLELKKALK